MGLAGEGNRVLSHPSDDLAVQIVKVGVGSGGGKARGKRCEAVKSKEGEEGEKGQLGLPSLAVPKAKVAHLAEGRRDPSGGVVLSILRITKRGKVGRG